MLAWPSEVHGCALMQWSRCLAQCCCLCWRMFWMYWERCGRWRTILRSGLYSNTRRVFGFLYMFVSFEVKNVEDLHMWTYVDCVLSQVEISVLIKDQCVNKGSNYCNFLASTEYLNTCIAILIWGNVSSLKKCFLWCRILGSRVLSSI